MLTGIIEQEGKLTAKWKRIITVAYYLSKWGKNQDITCHESSPFALPNDCFSLTHSSVPWEAGLSRPRHPAPLSSGFQLGSPHGKHKQKVTEGRKGGLECSFPQLSPCWALVWQCPLPEAIALSDSSSTGYSFLCDSDSSLSCSFRILIVPCHHVLQFLLTHLNSTQIFVNRPFTKLSFQLNGLCYFPGLLLDTRQGEDLALGKRRGSLSILTKRKAEYMDTDVGTWVD